MSDKLKELQEENKALAKIAKEQDAKIKALEAAKEQDAKIKSLEGAKKGAKSHTKSIAPNLKEWLIKEGANPSVKLQIPRRPERKFPDEYSDWKEGKGASNKEWRYVALGDATDEDVNALEAINRLPFYFQKKQ